MKIVAVLLICVSAVVAADPVPNIEAIFVWPDRVKHCPVDRYDGVSIEGGIATARCTNGRPLSCETTAKAVPDINSEARYIPCLADGERTVVDGFE